MAIKFKHYPSQEIRVADSEPLIAALYNSSDKGPNANNGQDFGWRLAPEVVIQMRRIMRDELTLERIAARYKKPLDEIREIDVLTFISDTTKVENAPVAQDGDYNDQYYAEIKRLEESSSEELAPGDEDIDIEDLDEEPLLDSSPDSKPAKGDNKKAK